MISFIANGLFLVIAAIMDIRKKRLPVILLLVWIVSGMIIYAFFHTSDITDEIMGVILGAVFIAISLVSDGKLGLGDGMAVFALGVYLGGRGAGFTCIYALILSSIFSMIILISGRYARHREFPFIPFLLIGYLLHGAVIYI